MKKKQWKSFKNLERLLKSKKGILYAWSTIKVKYFNGVSKSLKKERFVCMVLKFGVSKSAIAFKIALSKLIDNYLRIKDSLLSPHCF